MTVNELYNSIGGDYSSAISRLIKEDRILKYLKMFLRDTSYQELENAVAGGDDKAAFAAAHTLKGVAANLSLTELSLKASDITEEFRNGRNPAAGRALMPGLSTCYIKVVNGIKNYTVE